METEEKKKTINTTVIIPNLNGREYLQNCLSSLYACENTPFPIIVVDNGSTDGSVELIRQHFPKVRLICFPENRGFSAAVNAGIRAAHTPWVILLNNDTTVEKHFVSCLTKALCADRTRFSVGAKMLSMSRPDLIDDAGDYYCALGWAFARGKGKNARRYRRPCAVFAACGGAAIYRKAVLEELGLFDEKYFAYLEDMDVGYRARMQGYVNWYEPGAVVYHAGSASSGSRYNAFKIRLSSRNSVYLLLKNMPFFQVLVNLPFLLAGFFIKFLFFAKKGYGGIYLRGLGAGLSLALSSDGKSGRIRFHRGLTPACIRIEGELLWNMLKRFLPI